MTRILDSFVDPNNVVKFLLFRYSYDGELVTNLKMQKLLYYTYVWNLVINKTRCFSDRFQAWPNGPVLPAVYRKLKKYGSSPISTDFLDIEHGVKDLDSFKKLLTDSLNQPLVKIVDQIYEKYGIRTAFELVAMTHNETPWILARKSSIPSSMCAEISDQDIQDFYGKTQKN